MHSLERDAANCSLAFAPALLLHLQRVAHAVKQVDPQPPADACDASDERTWRAISEDGLRVWSICG
jgi:hypothetical protein